MHRYNHGLLAAPPKIFQRQNSSDDDDERYIIIKHHNVDLWIAFPCDHVSEYILLFSVANLTNTSPAMANPTALLLGASSMAVLLECL